MFKKVLKIKLMSNYIFALVSSINIGKMEEFELLLIKFDFINQNNIF